MKELWELGELAKATNISYSLSRIWHQQYAAPYCAALRSKPF